MEEIQELQSIIRDFINSPRKQFALAQGPAGWNMLCSSLDVIGDTELAFNAYMESLKSPATAGELYTLLYGIMQALFIQQDAVKHTIEALGLEPITNLVLDDIRKARNESTGHPTKRGNGKSFNFISRVSMSRSGFTLMTTFPDQDPKFRYVNVVQHINDQRDILKTVLTQVIEKLRKEEMDHRAEFKDEKLEQIFPQTLGYYYQKIAETIHGDCPPALGASMLGLITEMIQEFKSALDKRGIRQARNMEDFDFIEYPISELRKFFNAPAESKLNAKDAYIFMAFIKNQTDQLIQFARELDEEYSSSV
jgi:hypothetical protein